MGTYLSPQIDVIETDLTTVVPAVSTNICAMVGRFPKGPVNTRTLITNNRELESIFGIPDNDTYTDWFSAFNFLQQGDKLYITRVLNEDGIQTSLNGSHTNVITTLTVASTLDYPVSGRLSILYGDGGREIVSYSGKTSITFNNVIRGLAGSTASSYTGGETVILSAENASISVANTSAPFVSGTAATGSITFSTPSVLTHGDTITITDGDRSAIFATSKVRESSIVDSIILGAPPQHTFVLTTPSNYVTGDLVNITTDGTLPAGTSAGVNYFVRVLTSTSMSFHSSRSGAFDDNDTISVTDAGTGTHTIVSSRSAGITTPNAIPVDFGADADSVTVDDVGIPYQLMIDDLYAIDVVTAAPFITCPFAVTSGFEGTHTTTADADAHYPGSVITTSVGDKGIVRHIVNNRLYVQVTNGTFDLAEGVDNVDTYVSTKTQVISSTKIVDITATYLDPTVTLTNNNTDAGAELGNSPILVSEATPSTYVIVGMAGAIDPKNSRSDYILRFSDEVDPESTITYSENEVVKVYAKSPGAWASTLAVAVTNAEEFDNAIVFRNGNQVATFAGSVDRAPREDKREIALVVIETDRLGNRRIVEAHVGSLSRNSKTLDGGNNYIENVVNNNSTRVYVAVNPVTNGDDLTVSNLTAPLTNNATTALVTSTNGFAEAGRIKIDDEIISYTSTTSTTFDGLVRGDANTIAVEHAVDVEIVEYNTVGTVTDARLVGGADGINVRDDITGEIIAGYDLYNDREVTRLNIVIDGGNANNVTIQQHIIDNIVEKRRDCIAVLSVPWWSVNYPTTTQKIAGMIEYRSSPGNVDSLNRFTSYAALYGNWKRQYDKYSEVFRDVPTAGDAAGMYAFTDATRDPWYAPAGENRGKMKNVSQLKVQPNKAQRGIMYSNDINPLVDLESSGPVAWGQKTLLGQPSAFDRVNVRRLFLVVEDAIARASRPYLFEFNDVITRKRMLSVIEPFLRDVQGRRGITDFYVQLDERNNTPQVIQRNELRGDIYIKPAFVAEFIILNFIATPPGANFQELIKQN